MADAVIFQWISNKPEVERFSFKAGYDTAWSFGRLSNYLFQPPTLRRENNIERNLYVKMKFSSANVELKRCLSFVPGLRERNVNLTMADLNLPREGSTLQVKLQCVLTVYSVFDFDVRPVLPVPIEDTVETTALRTKPVDKAIPKMVLQAKFLCLSQNIYSLLRTGDYSDVVVACGNKEIKAHKSILSARSPVFAGMFLHQMKENIKNRVELNDMDENVFLEVIHYIYTGVVSDSNFDVISGLYVAADQYDMEELRTICRVFLINKITMDTIVDIIILSDIYCDGELKRSSAKFISEHFRKLRSSQAWTILLKEHQNLGLEILNMSVNNLLLQK